VKAGLQAPGAGKGAEKDESKQPLTKTMEGDEMLKLYESPLSGYVQKVKIALLEKGTIRFSRDIR